MKTLLPVAICLATVIALAAILLLRKKSPPKKELGFKEVVKNPEYWDQLSKNAHAAEVTLAQARIWDQAKVDRLARHFLFDVESSFEARDESEVLIGLGSRAFPEVFKALRDSAGKEKLLKKSGQGWMSEAPFNRACKLLVENPPAEAASLMEPYISDSRDDVRKEAALVLGSAGSAQAIAPLKRALGDQDEYVRAYALMGLLRACEAHRLSDECNHALFGDIQKLLSEGENADDDARVLVAMNPNQATDFFLSAPFFDIKSKGLFHALDALEQRNVSIPREKLLSLLQKLDGAAPDFYTSRIARAALRGLGRHRNAADRALLESRMASAEEEISSGAADGLLAWHGIGDFEKRMREKEEKAGSVALSVEQRRYFAIYDLDGEVRNGGFDQYFVNSSGNTWHEALLGLDVIGATERASIVREAIAKFGKDGPSVDRKERQAQLAKLANNNDKTFDDLESRYYKSKENLSPLTARFVIKNASAFR